MHEAFGVLCQLFWSLAELSEWADCRRIQVLRPTTWPSAAAAIIMSGSLVELAEDVPEGPLITYVAGLISPSNF